MSSKEPKSTLPEEEVVSLHKKELARRKTHQDNMQKQAEEERQQWLLQEKVYKEKLLALENVCNQKDAQISQLSSQLASCDGRDATLKEKTTALYQELVESKAKHDIQLTLIQLHEESIAKLKEEKLHLKEVINTKNSELDEMSAAVNHHVTNRIVSRQESKGQMSEELQILAVAVQELQERVLKALDDLQSSSSSNHPSEDMITRVNKLDSEIDFQTKSYLRTLHDVRQKISSLADAMLLAKIGKTMHSNLGVDVKHQLSMLDRDQLIIVLDCLSYQEGVSSFLASELPLHSHKDLHIPVQKTIVH